MAQAHQFLAFPSDLKRLETGQELKIRLWEKSPVKKFLLHDKKLPKFYPSYKLRKKTIYCTFREHTTCTPPVTNAWEGRLAWALISKHHFNKRWLLAISSHQTHTSRTDYAYNFLLTKLTYIRNDNAIWYGDEFLYHYLWSVHSRQNGTQICASWHELLFA